MRGRARGTNDAHPVRCLLTELHVGDVQDAVGRDVAVGIVDLVQHLLGAGGNVEPPARIWRLAQRDGTILRHVDEREAEPGEIIDVLHPRIGEAAAGELPGAFQHMSGQRAGGKLIQSS